MLHKDFSDEMNRYYADGTTPVCVTNDFRYSLDMHQRRLKSRGLKIRRAFLPDGDHLPSSLIKDSGEYSMSLNNRHISYSCEYIRNDASNAVIKRVNERRMLNTIELDKKNDGSYRVSPDTEFICPNCGSRGTYAVFINGCTSCGTRFRMDQIYPSIAYYYTYPELIDRTKVQKTNRSFGKGVATAFIIVDSLAAVIAYIAGYASEASIWKAVLFAIIVVAFASAIVGIISFIAFMIYGATLATSFASNASKTLSEGIELNVANKRKEEMVSALTQYIPDFSYEYFEGKVTSHLRTITYTDNRQNLTIYQGTGDLSSLDDVVDVDYRGALEYLNCSVKDGILNVDIKAYTFMSHQLSNGVIDRRKEQYKIRMSRKNGMTTRPEFSINAVNCESCGASFDASYELTCPTCGHRYEPMNDEWVITHMVLDKDI